MTTMTPLADQELLAGLRGGDEQALERLLRSRYDALHERARQELGSEAASAPRVVEHVMLRVWDERAQLPSVEALDTFLHDAIHTESVRERSRRAARHRFEAHHHLKHDAAPAETPPPEVEWAHVMAALHPPAVDPSAHRELVKHDAAQHMASIVKRRPWKGPVVLGSMLAVAIFGGLLYADRNSGETVIRNALASNDARFVQTRAAQQGQMSLDDGTQATLGPDSRITIPVAFGPRVRAVGVEGVMSFVVTKPGAEMPFQARIGQAIVASNDASFAVRMFPGEAWTAVAVRTGTVTVTLDDTERTLGAGQTLLVSAKGEEMRAPTDAERAVTLGWMANEFAVENQKLADVLPQIVRWYATSFELDPKSLGERPITLRAPLGETKTLIQALEQSGRVRFEWRGARMMLVDAAAPAR